ncbi:MAG: acyl-CoA thioesterase II [Saprospiraceae bacterium]|nr:acyl-CoA thioesterase II [Saprospiraceae bacterium]MCB9323637.1 acyl-CoA thioesterase II [Lewinellaceae bacterium]
MKNVSELLDLLNMEQLEYNLFRGQSSSIGSKRVFGGQVLAQSLSAAMQTVPSDRFVHSLHAYFILPGDITMPIVFDVETIRDGGSFTTRRVKAIQKGKVILNFAASFQLQQEGFDHQIEMPEITPPEALANWQGLVKEYGDIMPESFRKFLDRERPIEFKPVERFNPFSNDNSGPFRHVWIKAKGTIPDDPRMQNLVLAYASDYNLLTTALMPHGQLANWQDLTLASLDHAMWFHRPFDMNEWMLYQTDSPSASGARGFSRGNIFTREGKLVASVVQEGLIRPKRN